MGNTATLGAAPFIHSREFEAVAKVKQSPVSNARANTPPTHTQPSPCVSHTVPVTYRFLPDRDRACKKCRWRTLPPPPLLSPLPPTPCIHFSRCDQRFLREYALGPVSDPEDGVGDDGDASGERALAVGVACVPKIVSNTESTTP